MRQRRVRGWVMMGVGVVVLGISIATEWVGVAWWSSVDLVKLKQTYVVLGRGQVQVGERGTAGFFNRGIPAAGARVFWPWTNAGEPLTARLIPRRVDAPQVKGVGIPLAPLGVLAMGVGFWMVRAARHRSGVRCHVCGYDTRGLKRGLCPECGTLVTACASSTSQPG